MSSRLFQNIREQRGLAYAVSSGLSSYRDAGMLTVYAGCDAGAVPEVVKLVVDELRTLTAEPVPPAELQRAKDHLKGNLVLGLESTTSRMSQLARSEIYFGRQIDVSEILSAIDGVSAGDVQRVATDLFAGGPLLRVVEYYAPVHLLLHAAGWQAFGSEVRGHHALNIGMHTLASCLLVLVFRKLHRLVEMHEWQHNLFFGIFAPVVLWGTHLAFAIPAFAVVNVAIVGIWLAVVGGITREHKRLSPDA